ncbi:hypothetical protein ACFFQF_15745 [Haladaptatus pallidirubidus]|uniref:hypothetical protein n=1 Tax=Haladaptatus pallidirubidus TaxID=1008152 RepID=UPI0035F0A2BB
MALAGLAGLGIAGTNSASAASSTYLELNGSNSMNADLDVGGYNVVNTGDIFLGDDILAQTKFASFSTYGQGDGKVQIWDVSNSQHLVRANEGGPVDIGTDLNISEGGLSINNWKIVDMVEAGADPTGNEAIDTILENEASDNTLLVFPKGTYRLDSSFELNADYSKFGMIGQPHATFEIANNLGRPAIYIGGSTAPDELILRNITVDIGTNGVDAPALHAFAKNKLDVDTFDLEGARNSNKVSGWIETVMVGVTCNPDSGGNPTERGFAHVKNLHLPDGGNYLSGNGQTGQFIGIGSVDPDKVGQINSQYGIHRGTMVFDSCYVEGFRNNGLYVSGYPGNVHVRDSHLKNNGLTNIRLSDGDSARDCRIEIDDNTLDSGGNQNPEAMALWGQEGDVLFENIEIERTSGTNRLLRDAIDGYETVFRDIDIVDNGTGDVLEFTHGGDVVLENVRVDKNAGSSYTSRIIDSATTNVTLKNVRYNSTARGIVFRNIEKVSVHDSSFDANNYAIEVKDTRSTKKLIFENNPVESGTFIWYSGRLGAIRDNHFKGNVSLQASPTKQDVSNNLGY